jgi:transcriptional regulator with XRE-family HTH domain
MKQPTLGLKIREIRIQKGLSQEDLSFRCKMNVRTIQRIENGSVIPRPSSLRIISDVLEYNFFENNNISFEFSKLKFDLPRVSFILISIFFLGFILTMISSDIIKTLAFYPDRMINTKYFFTFISYSILHSTIDHFFWVSIFVLLCGLILEKRIKIIGVIILILFSVVSGAFIYGLITESNAGLIGGSFIFFGYLGTLLALYFRERSEFNNIEKIVIFIALAYILFSVLLNIELLDLWISKLLVMTLTVLISLFIYTKKFLINPVH